MSEILPKPAAPRDDEAARQRQRLRQHLARSAYWMDERFRIPGTPIRFGLDALIGFVPLAGDVIGYLVGLWLVLEARAAGAPRELQRKMLQNHGIELLVGWVPLLGDLFDFAWRAHSRNRALAEEWLEAQELGPEDVRHPRRWLWLVVLAALPVLIYFLAASG